jgi:hypothetical protein
MVIINKNSEFSNCNKSNAYVANAALKILCCLNLFLIMPSIY